MYKCVYMQISTHENTTYNQNHPLEQSLSLSLPPSLSLTHTHTNLGGWLLSVSSHPADSCNSSLWSLLNAHAGKIPRRPIAWQNFAKLSSLLTLHSKFGCRLTFEDVYQAMGFGADDNVKAWQCVLALAAHRAVCTSEPWRTNEWVMAHCMWVSRTDIHKYTDI